MMVTGHTTASFSSGTSVSIGATSAQVLAANPHRLGFILTNNGAKACYVGGSNVAEGGTARAGGGVLLAPGATLAQSQMGGYTGVLHAVTSGSDTTVVGVLEW